MAVRTVLGQAARGVLMGSADIVPGVSGGTVALVLGIYERLIANIHTGAQALQRLVRGRFGEFAAGLRRVEWVWLLSLLAGILVAVLALATVIEMLLTQEPVRMAALFLGLVAGSVVVAWRLLRRRDVSAVVITLVVAAAFFLLLGLREDVHPTEGAAELAWWAFLGSGALAICAMILPGISGSFVLVLLGSYGAVLGAATDLDVVSLGLFAIGCVLGLALFSTFLNWALRNHHDRVIAVMIGLMLGSLRVLWPWPGGSESTALGAPSGDVVVPVLLALAGLALVLVVEVVASRRAAAAGDVDRARTA